MSSSRPTKSSGSRKQKPTETPHRVVVTRMVKERGEATIMVPKGRDPSEVLEEMRQDGDDFLQWDTLGISDLAIDIDPQDQPVRASGQTNRVLTSGE